MILMENLKKLKVSIIKNDASLKPMEFLSNNPHIP